MPRTLRVALAIAGMLAVVAAGTAAARQMKPMDHQMNDFKPFTQDAFKTAMAEGKTTLVFFHAPWCPVCTAQEPKVKAQLNGDHKNIVAFKVDYDSNGPLRKDMNVDKQSTLILFSGHERDRATELHERGRIDRRVLRSREDGDVGSAVSRVARSETLPDATMIMAAFGLGSATLLLAARSPRAR